MKNQRPVAVATITPEKLQLPFNQATLDLSKSYDPNKNGKIISYRHSIVGPAVCEILNPSLMMASVKFDTPGSYVYTGEVKDRGGLTGTVSKIITVQQTKFGAMISGGTDDVVVLSKLGTNITREAIILDRFTGRDKALDLLLDAGMYVMVNLNCSAVLKDASGNKIPNPFIKDMDLYRSMLKPALDVYGSHPQILCFVIENEPTNRSYHSGPMSDYLTMLETAIPMVHAKGANVADGCVHVELVMVDNPTSEGNAADVLELLEGYKNLRLDYVNLHTHGSGSFYPLNRIQDAATKVRNISGHLNIISNEWHCEGTDDAALAKLITSMINQWKDAGTIYSAYISGGSDKNAPLSIDSALTPLGITYRNQIG